MIKESIFIDSFLLQFHTEGYRSGHNEAVLKTVWAHAHKGSNPFPSAKSPEFFGAFFDKNMGLIYINPINKKAQYNYINK